MKIAVEGCGHGELDKIYETIQFLEQKEGIKVDLLLCCGDFQSVRNESDLECMAVPKKYRTINTFYKYYSGEKTAPILTIFIGGNHEASNYLSELPYGGWVCPNIYYMGYASVLNYGGVRIGGMSGIFKGRDFRKGHYEKPPYSQDTMRSAYHIRNLEVFRLKQIKQHMDIMMSHDWPKGVYRHGDKEALIRRKPFLREEVNSNSLGSGPTEEVLNTMKPEYWFSAHLHVKFAALVQHKEEDDGTKKQTKFLSLDKCLPRRDFLQVVDIAHKSEPPFELCYDAEWFAILKETNHLLHTTPELKHMPAQFFCDRWDYSVTLEQLSAVRAAFGDNLKVPMNFSKTVPAYDPSKPIRNAHQPNLCINPQTTELCTKLGITDPCVILRNSTPGGGDQGDVSIGEDEDDPTFTSFMLDSSTANPNEISLDDDDGDSETEDDSKGDSDVKQNRSRLSMSLPPVKGDDSSTTSSVPPDLGSPMKGISFPDPTDGSLRGELTTSTPLVPRIIKRRNLDIYAAFYNDSASDGQGSSEAESGEAENKEEEVVKEEVPVQGSGPGRQIKIKRRNQSMYTADDDDD